MRSREDGPAHEPVLLKEVAALLVPDAERPRVLVDATVGLGGHSEALLERAHPESRLVAIDRDPEALAIAARRLARFGDRVRLVHGRFADLAHLLEGEGVAAADAVLADLGVSSLQLDEPRRGFSFRASGDVDMRMDQTRGETAGDLLARSSEAELAQLLREYGEEPSARRIAHALTRAPRPETTDELRAIVAGAVRSRSRDRDPATRTFQALRIAVNRELEELDRLLAELPSHLAPGARVAILAYHSLEDRRVKNAFRSWTASCVCPPELPVCRCGGTPRALRLTHKAVAPSAEEIARNPRSRSARLRAVEWIGGR
ncbi:MAG TPA: 16S rRNA (cytosine(1402)-N(4))-methyltransferase RsmH [Candidatus Binatia bacterium]|nr:16S rRNA (cytosine(1402)-N(4))-methyltransferase RsmH [Candidatus Binatia bacterium]